MGIWLLQNNHKRTDGKGFLRLIHRKPVNVKVERLDTVLGDTLDVVAQLPGDCVREVKIRMMFIEESRVREVRIEKSD